MAKSSTTQYIIELRFNTDGGSEFNRDLAAHMSKVLEDDFGPDASGGYEGPYVTGVSWTYREVQ